MRNDEHAVTRVHERMREPLSREQVSVNAIYSCFAPGQRCDRTRVEHLHRSFTPLLQDLLASADERVPA